MHIKESNNNCDDKNDNYHINSNINKIAKKR